MLTLEQQKAASRARNELYEQIQYRSDLSDAERRTCWLLLYRRTIRTTGAIFCSDTDIAKTLSLNIGTVSRVKRRLRDLGILKWTPGSRAGTASSYFFLIGSSGVHAGTLLASTQVPVPASTQVPVPASTQVPKHTPTRPFHGQIDLNGSIWLDEGTTDFDKADDILKQTNGYRAPRGTRNAGYFFPKFCRLETLQ